MFELRTDAATLTMMWQTVLLGMMMVFSVLALLWAVLTVFKAIFVGKTEKKPKEAKQEKSVTPSDQPISDDVMQAVITAGIQAYQEDREKEMVAVLTAAVSAYREAEGESGEFRVVSFRRASGKRSWNSKK